jgi:hypothetical protein|tara:strand:+ start:2399 stop:2767 length:369 start_codon:yes stop_codon:yes gene_type:complete
MALIVAGATLTSGANLDASKLTGTASAINGSNITNLPAPSSANVGTANAGLAVNSVGSYALCTVESSNSGQNAGDTFSGDGLRYANCNGQRSGTPSGTWRCMGYTLTTTNSTSKTTNWLRIS